MRLSAETGDMDDYIVHNLRGSQRPEGGLLHCEQYPLRVSFGTEPDVSSNYEAASFSCCIGWCPSSFAAVCSSMAYVISALYCRRIRRVTILCDQAHPGW